MRILTLILAVTLIASCSTGSQQEETAAKDVEMVTSAGTIVLRLYDETPQHRDNFLKLVEEQFYDSILFHRVIQNFVIQAGDPESKTATIEDTVGLVDLPYTVPSEFHPDVFHKRGALGAARDNNPARASSSTQFYIVQGRVYSDSLLEVQLGRINRWLAMNRVVNDSANMELVAERDTLFASGDDSVRLSALNERFDALVETSMASNEEYVYPDAHREFYQTIGGAAHLDQNYTVFGEVVSGLDIVDAIGAMETNDMDRPIEPVRIITTRLIDRKEY